MSDRIFKEVTLRRLPSSDRTTTALTRPFSIATDEESTTEDFLCSLLVRLTATWAEVTVPYDYSAMSTALMRVLEVTDELEPADLSPAWQVSHLHHQEDDGTDYVCVSATPTVTTPAEDAPRQVWSIELSLTDGDTVLITIIATELRQLVAGVIHAYTRAFVPQVSQLWSSEPPSDVEVLDIVSLCTMDLSGRLFAGRL